MVGDIVLPISTTFWWIVPQVYLDEVLVTAAAPADSFAVTLVDQSDATVSSGSMSHDPLPSTESGDWGIKLTTPATPGRYRLKANAVKGSSTGKWRRTLIVEHDR